MPTERKSAAMKSRDGIYAERGNFESASSVYLYYVVRDDPELSRVYYYYDNKNTIRSISDRLRSMLKNARERKNGPPAAGQFLSDVNMRRASCVAIVVEDVELHAETPIRIFNKGTNVESTHTFSDARRLQLSARIGDHVIPFSAAIVANSITRMPGYEWEPGKPERFKISCYDAEGNDIFDEMRIRFNMDRDRHEHESGGTNMGPPVGPP